jgi:hypothetical protein
MTELKNVVCGECQKRLSDEGPCPHCGSSVRCVDVSLAIESPSNTHVGMRQKRPGSKRPLVEMVIGKVLRKSVGDFVQKYWRLDRAADRYVEHIETEDGEVLRHVDETLREHHGHGSDKPEFKAARLAKGKKAKAVR